MSSPWKYVSRNAHFTYAYYARNDNLFVFYTAFSYVCDNRLQEYIKLRSLMC